MPNTYTQIHIHAVFAVKFRAALIGDVWREQLHQYITGIVRAQGHKMLSINSMPDHMHVFFGMRPTQSLSDLLQDIKGGSSLWINAERFITRRFEWQGGFSAFSYCRAEVPKVINYIRNQQEHHRRQKFLDEYRQLLAAFEIEYDDRYIFSDPV